MYRCTDCKKVFVTAKAVYEKHGLTAPPYERRLVCPMCGSEAFRELEVRHCRCCGARLKENRFDYCNDDCRVRGEKLWKREARRRMRRDSDPLCMLVAEVERYNRQHGTALSYGTYIALVRKEGSANGKTG